jgi:3-phenylpropionate/trans-cinnamate dioxygenase ferredoxin component
VESNHDVRRGTLANWNDVKDFEETLVKWIDAGPAASLSDGQTLSIAVGRRVIAVARSGAEYFAIDDVCTHDGAELTGGSIEGSEIICPRHGARFCLRTGEALTPPAYEPVRVYETKIEGDHLWVNAD